MSNSRVWYHVRVREMVRPGVYVKKSKFYEASRPGDAVKKYVDRARKNGTEYTIMWCEKDHRHDPERLADQTASLYQDIRAEQGERKRGLFRDVSDFARLGGELFQELQQTEKVKGEKRRHSYERKRLLGGLDYGK